MSLSEQFRQKAQYCSQVASTAEYRDKRIRFVEEARRWSRLAAEAERQESAVSLVPQMEHLGERLLGTASPSPLRRPKLFSRTSASLASASVTVESSQRLNPRKRVA